jgi:hypothetical protein
LNFAVWDSQVATHIADDHVSSKVLPFESGIEDLVQVAVEAEGLFAYITVEFEIAEPLLEGWESEEVRI